MSYRLCFVCMFFVLPLHAQIISKAGYTQKGKASYYPDDRKGAKTRSGEIYDKNALAGAHHYIAFNSLVKVTNLENKKVVVVRINDRPYTNERIIDLTAAAAAKLGIIGQATAQVQIELISPPEEQEKLAKEIKEEKFFSQVGTFFPNGTGAKPKGFGLQVAAFPELKTAIEQANRFALFKVGNVYIQAGWEGKKRSYRVLIGSYPKKEDAEKAKTELAQKKIESFVRAHFDQ